MQKRREAFAGVTRKFLTFNLPKSREVLDCGSPLPLLEAHRQWESGRGLPQSKTLSREPTPSKFSVLAKLQAS